MADRDDALEYDGEAPSDDIPEDLRELTERLDQPTGELPAVTPPLFAVDDLTEKAQTESAEEDEGAAVVPAEPPAEPEAAEPTSEPAEEGEPAGEEPIQELFDDIAPGTVAAAAQGESVETEAGAEAEALLDVTAPRAAVSWWPFVVYVVVWVLGAAYAVWQLQQLPAGQAAYETAFYSTATLIGLGLLGVGPVLLLVVWFASWVGREGSRVGLLFISALLKGAAATLLGAIIWIAALAIIDYLRLGHPL